MNTFQPRPDETDDVRAHGYGRMGAAPEFDVEAHGASRPAAPEQDDDVAAHGKTRI